MAEYRFIKNVNLGDIRPYNPGQDEGDFFSLVVRDPNTGRYQSIDFVGDINDLPDGQIYYDSGTGSLLVEETPPRPQAHLVPFAEPVPPPTIPRPATLSAPVTSESHPRAAPASAAQYSNNLPNTSPRNTIPNTADNTPTQTQPDTSTQAQPPTLTQVQPPTSTQVQPPTSTQVQPPTSTPTQPPTPTQLDTDTGTDVDLPLPSAPDPDLWSGVEIPTDSHNSTNILSEAQDAALATATVVADGLELADRVDSSHTTGLIAGVLREAVNLAQAQTDNDVPNLPPVRGMVGKEGVDGYDLVEGRIPSPSEFSNFATYPQDGLNPGNDLEYPDIDPDAPDMEFELPSPEQIKDKIVSFLNPDPSDKMTGEEELDRVKKEISRQILRHSAKATFYNLLNKVFLVGLCAVDGSTGVFGAASAYYEKDYANCVYAEVADTDTTVNTLEECSERRGRGTFGFLVLVFAFLTILIRISYEIWGVGKMGIIHKQLETDMRNREKSIMEDECHLFTDDDKRSYANVIWQELYQADSIVYSEGYGSAEGMGADVSVINTSAGYRGGNKDVETGLLSASASNHSDIDD